MNCLVGGIANRRPLTEHVQRRNECFVRNSRLIESVAGSNRITEAEQTCLTPDPHLRKQTDVNAAATQNMNVNILAAAAAAAARGSYIQQRSSLAVSCAPYGPLSAL